MNIILGVDQSGIVRLVGSGGDASNMPSEWNGLQITAYVLTDEQAQAYAALPSDRGHTTFDGVAFVAVPVAAESATFATFSATRERERDLEKLGRAVERLPEESQEADKLILKILQGDSTP